MTKASMCYRVLSILCVSLLGFVLASSVQADVTITVSTDVDNPPPSLASTSGPPQLAVADTATLVPAAAFGAILQATLNAQGFTNANGWTLNMGAVTLDPNATFNIDDYYLAPTCRKRFRRRI